MGEAELNGLVKAGVLSDRVTAGWRPALDELFPCLIPTKWWYLRIISGVGLDFLFIHS